MHFSDDDLRSALGRKEPSADFTGRVMASINKPQSSEDRLGAVPVVRVWWRSPWAMASALTACLLLVIGLVQHHQYEQREMETKKVRAQAVLAMRLTSEKLNVALRQALYPRRSNH